MFNYCTDRRLPLTPHDNHIPGNYDRNSLRCGIREGGVTGAFFETVTISHEKDLIHENRELYGFYLIIDQYNIVIRQLFLWLKSVAILTPHEAHVCYQYLHQNYNYKKRLNFFLFMAMTYILNIYFNL